MAKFTPRPARPLKAGRFWRALDVIQRLPKKMINGDQPPNLFNVPAGETTPALEAGAARRRLRLWQPAQVHINTALRNAGPTALARARWLGRNNGYGKSAITSWTAATVGAGITPTPQVNDEGLQERITQEFLDWTDEADAEELTDFYGITRRVAREAYIAGECFVRFRPRLPQDGLRIPLQLQVLPSEQLPLTQVQPAPTGYGNDGGEIRMGVEFHRNLRDKRVAYWFLRANPTDATVSFRDLLATDRLVRIPADEIIHVYDPVEAGQVRGLTRFAASVVKLFMLDAWDDAELERQKQVSNYASFIEKPAENDLETGLLVNQRNPLDDPAILMPGTIMEGFAGEKFTHMQPPGVAGTYEPFQYRVLLALCAGLGVPYAELTGDLNRTTYASSRAGLLAFRSEIEAFQNAVLIFQFIRRTWIRWMDTAVLVGALPISAQAYNANLRHYRKMKAIPPRAPWVDPLKDRQAIKLALDSQTMSLQDAIAAEGSDIETVFRQIGEENELREKYGIPRPSPGWGARRERRRAGSNGRGRERARRRMIRDLARIQAILFNRPHCIWQPKLDALVVGFRAAQQQRGSRGTGWTSLSSDEPVVPVGTGGERPRGYRIDRGVALLPVHGVLARRRGMISPDSTELQSYENLSQVLRRAYGDQRVRGILLDIDSPGGEAGGVFDFADQIRAASRSKPTWSIANDGGMSAAYVIAAASDRIWATRTADVGSLGVVAVHQDRSAADEMDGVRYTFIYRGARKIDGHPHGPLSAEAQSGIQGDIDELYEMLIDTVARNRRLEPARLRETEADIYRRDAAIDRGLVDRIGTLGEAHAALVDHVAQRGRTPMNDQPPGFSGFVEDPPAPPAPDNVIQLRVNEALADHRAQTREIANLCKLAKLPELATDFIARGATVAQVQEALLARQATDDERRAIIPIDTTAVRQNDGAVELQRLANDKFAAQARAYDGGGR